jgi:hypothetical protein
MPLSKFVVYSVNICLCAEMVRSFIELYPGLKINSPL